MGGISRRDDADAATMGLVNDHAIFVFDGGDLSVYPTIAAAAAGSEIYDVSVLSYFGDDGTVLQATVDGYRVWLTPTTERRPDELRERLRAYLEHHAVGFDPALADDLVSAARALLDVSQETRSLKRFPWLDRRVRRESPATWPPEPRGNWSWSYALLAAPCAALIFGVFVSLYGPNIVNLYRLAAVGVQTQGIVSGVNNDNHEACKYAFTVDGRSYGGSGTEDCADTAKLDTSDRITYLPSNPAVSEDGSVVDAVWVRSLIIAVGATFAAVGAASPKGWRRAGRRR
jgi:hypothetical protein